MSLEDKKVESLNGIGAAAEKAISFLEKIVAGPIIEGTGILTDKIKLWRFKNQVNIINKAKKFLDEKGVATPKNIPVKDVMTLLEYASFEDEEIMTDSWANLLANALDPKNQFNSCHIFSQILNQLSINEIYILSYMFSNSFLMSSDDRPYFEKNKLISNSNNTQDYYIGFLLIDNLLRLRLIEEEPPKLKFDSRHNYIYGEDVEIPKNEIIKSESFRLSQFGVEFFKEIT